jgi:hypothetical protein
MMERFFGQLEKPSPVPGDNKNEGSVLDPDLDWIAEQGDEDESNVLRCTPSMDTFVVGRKLGETFVGFYLSYDSDFRGNDGEENNGEANYSEAKYAIELLRKMNGQ